MFESKEHETAFLFYLRWAARLTSIVCLAIIFFFFIGEGVDYRTIDAKEWIGILFFPLGVFIGLVLAWREEGLGGAISIISISAFYIIYGLLLNGKFWQGWAFLPFLVPGILFLAYWYFSHPKISRNHNTNLSQKPV